MCTNSDFFPRNSCTLPQGSDDSWCKDHLLERSLYHSENLHFIWASSWCIYPRENIFVAKKYRESSRGTSKSIVKISWNWNSPIRCHTALGEPVWRWSLSCQSPSISLVKVDVSWRWFSDLPGKQTYFSKKYRWLTYLFFCTSGLSSCSHSSMCLTGINFQGLQKES